MEITRKQVRDMIRSQEDDDFFIGRHVFGYLGYQLAYLFLKTRITPNQITWIWGAMMTLSSLLLIFNCWYLNIITGICWIIAYSMDYADGAVARLKNHLSRRGAFLDFINHTVSYFALFTCAGIGVWHTGGCPYWDFIPDVCYIFLGAIAGLGIDIIMLMPTLARRANPDDTIGSSNDIEARNFGGMKKFIIFMTINPLTFTNMMFLIVFFAIFDQMWLFVLAYGLGSFAASIARFATLYRRIPARYYPPEEGQDASAEETPAEAEKE